MVKGSTQPDALVAWMESLADPTRLRLLLLLERNELGVAELCEIVQLPQSTVSRHLKLLADQHWVCSRRHATTRLYRMILDELKPPARRLWLLAREQTDAWPTVRQDQLRLARRLRDRENASQSFFAGAAAQWDKLRAELYGDRFVAAACCALIPPDWTVVDLGCGTGSLVAELAPYVRQVIGIDNSAAMLKTAARRTAELNNVRVLRGDLQAIPLENGTCDAAMLLLVLTYVSQPAAVLREMARIVKPGGRAVIVDLLPHDRDDFRRQLNQQHAGFGTEAMRDMLQEAGFDQSTVRPLTPQVNTKGPALFLATAITKKSTETEQSKQ
ncbi:MAG: metalloregulator ArsR/SmtB family transcription factor [Phycisphaerales bacterium]|jgi:ArsR family transcriptional regulator|nr:metalloregulator ArsR/SmtB family transcription factor [Phycisphaerales bacterium]